ncbi:MAG: helix-turn-helix transcriptional regulator [bacterium]|nr:helix-turn-helix transcriptional regulator [bacterium]
MQKEKAELLARMREEEKENMFVTTDVRNQTPMDFYRERRGYTISQLADETDISRQTIGKACSGEIWLKRDNLQRVADALDVDLEDLVQEEQGKYVPKTKMLNVEWYQDLIMKAFSQCKPQLLPTKVKNAVNYFCKEDADVDSIVSYLTQTANDLAKCELARIVKNYYRRNPQYFQNYNARIWIGYAPIEEEEGEYQVFILFEDWVYETFGLKCPVSKVSISKEDGSQCEMENLDFDMEVTIYEEPGTMEFEMELEDQVLNAILYEVSNAEDARLAQVFDQFLEDNRDNIKFQEYVLDDSDEVKQAAAEKIQRRTEEYRKLIVKVCQDCDIEHEIDKLAEVWERIRREEGYEEQLFEEYGLNTEILK